MQAVLLSYGLFAAATVEGADFRIRRHQRGWDVAMQ